MGLPRRLAPLLVLALAACEPAPVTEADRLRLAYESAAIEWNVPRPILEGIGWISTRWHMRPGVPAVDGCYGTMHLCDWGEDGPLARAAKLSGLSEEALRTDREANIRAAAALLRAEADRYFAETRHLSDMRMADWWQVVMRYSNAVDADVADGYATQVFQAVNRGNRGLLEDGSLYEAAPAIVDVSREKLFGTMASPLTPDYAQAHWKPALRYTSGREGRQVDRIIIHTAQGYYAGTISWFQNPSVQASAHYVIRSSDGDVTQMVENRHTAWHAGNWEFNLRSIGIEHEGFVDQPSWLTQEMYQSSANLTRWLADTYGIPKNRQHIIGHNEVPNPSPGQNGCTNAAFGGCSAHRDPCVTLDGSQCFWNWNHYMSLVGGSSNPVTTGSIRGTVFSSEGGCVFQGGFQNCDVRVPGARVYIPETGDTTLSDANGNFGFELPPGTYTPSGSASGFQDAGPVLGPRTVVAGEISWSSFILQKLSDTGVVKGFVYERNPQNGLDRSKKIEGAVVSTSDTNVTSTNADGEFRLTVPAGTVTVTAARAGYITESMEVNVLAGTERVAEIGLRAGGEDQEGPVITFTRPAARATVRQNPLLVEGTVNEPVFGLQVNGKEALVGEDLKWSANVDLVEGENTIVAIASDESHNVSEASLVVIYLPPGTGVDGRVLDARTEAPVAGAVVTAGTAFAQTGTDGKFALELAPGLQALAVQAQGYQARSVSVTVPVEGRATLDVLVTPAAASAVLINEPADGSTFTTSPIVVRGNVSLSPVAYVRVNGVAATYIDGAFVGHADLLPGQNTITVVASTGEREESASVTVTYAPPVEEDGCGCAGAGVESVFGLLALLGLVRRARRSM